MKTKLTKEQIDQINKVLEDALAEGPWEQSNFLKAIGKNLREIQKNFLNRISGGKAQTSSASAAKHKPVQQRRQTGQQEIFVTLYSSEGSSLGAWERILSNLPRQVISRPIYGQEEDAAYMIRSKENRANEAYVSIFIEETDVITLSEKPVVDKLGKPLLTLKDNAIHLENIQRFVHLSGSYDYVKGRLILK